jgi:hypothetical protein
MITLTSEFEVIKYLQDNLDKYINGKVVAQYYSPEYRGVHIIRKLGNHHYTKVYISRNVVLKLLASRIIKYKRLSTITTRGYILNDNINN